MRITKRQLRRIIREERGKLVREQPDRYGEFGNFDTSPRDRYEAQQPGPGGLYVNLTDEQENALNDLDAAMAVCVRAGCSSADVMDTIQGYNLK